MVNNNNILAFIIIGIIIFKYIYLQVFAFFQQYITYPNDRGHFLNF